MTRLWLMSDLHLEASPDPDAFDPARPDFDVLVCPGDVWQGRTDLGFAALHRLADDAPIVMIMGNHEHWNGEVGENLAEARLWADAHGVTLLDGEMATIAGVRFVGATLWTDYALAGSSCDLDAETGEAVMVRHDGGEHWLTAADAVALHRRDRARLTALIAAHDDPALPLVVVTHHAPHPDCLASDRLGLWGAGADASDLSDVTDVGVVAVWAHGHIHTSHDRVRPGGTRILRNPAGRGRENTAFEEGLVIAV